MGRNRCWVAVFLLVGSFWLAVTVSEAGPLDMATAVSFATPPLLIDERSAIDDIEGVPPLPPVEREALPTSPYDRLFPRMPPPDVASAPGATPGVDPPHRVRASFDLSTTLFAVGVALLIAAPIVTGLVFFSSRRRSWYRRLYATASLNRRPRSRPHGRSRV
jgi:hypothetical protein